MLGFVSAHIPWNAISNLEFRRTFNALRTDLVLPSRSTLSNICRREYTLTIEAIINELPESNKVSLALDGWTSTTKLAITSVIAYYIDRNWNLKEVQLAFDEVCTPPISRGHTMKTNNLEGERKAYWRTTSRPFERCTQPFWAL